MGNKIIKGINDLTTLRPDLAKQWHPTKNIGLVNGHGEDASTPETVTLDSDILVWWLCDECGYEWQIAVKRRRRFSKCPCCSGRYVVEGKNDLLTKYPTLADEWNYDKNTILPNQVLPLHNKMVYWKCTNGHSWRMPIKVRVNNNLGCPYCAGANPNGKGLLLRDLRPDLLRELHPTKNQHIDPNTISAYSRERVFWIAWKIQKDIS